MAACFTSCKTKQIGENVNIRDSVRVEYVEKIVEVPVTVTIEVPAETAERETRDSTSHLETSFAKSDASMVWRDGVPYLFHSLENKPQKIEKTENVNVKYQVVRETKYRTEYRTKILEKRLTTWQKVKVEFGGVAIFILLIMLIGWLVKRYAKDLLKVHS